MGMPKISLAVAEVVRQAEAGATVEVVLELSSQTTPTDPSLSRQEKISTLKMSFQHDSAPIEQLVAEHGGEVIDRAWLNQTLRVRASADCLEKLAQLDEVSAIDVPHSLTRG